MSIFEKFLHYQVGTGFKMISNHDILTKILMCHQLHVAGIENVKMV